jgi:hypothetical protein
MAAEFATKPPVAVNVPKPVDVASLPEEQRKLYEGLETVAEKLPDLPEQPPAGGYVPPPEPDLDEAYYRPDEDDKRAFVRALLGGKQFEKRFKLFNAIEVTLLDRSTEHTEMLFNQLEVDANQDRIKTGTDDQWITWNERYCLATTLRIYKDGSGEKGYLPTDKLHERVQELMKLPKPVYQALLQTSRRFEIIVQTLTRRAHDKDFWLTGGADSPSKPTPGAR